MSPEVDPQSLQNKLPEQAAPVEPRTDLEKAAACGVSSTARQPKRIYVCCDGTGNEFGTAESLDGNSNVVKLYTALKLDSQHVAYYHPGVGTMGDPNTTGIREDWSMVKGLAFGHGFRDNVLDAYRYLMQHYATGDVVYIFGFSRGAYTARALAGLLHGYGLLCRGNEGHIPYAWRMYSARIASQKEMNARTIKTDTSFRDTFSHRTFTIYFVGLWDTVSSVGWVSTPLRLLDMAENATIQMGRHAVSVDERRCFYRDNLWGDAVDVAKPPALIGTDEGNAILTKQDQQQVWFPGVHSDVGGSYPQLQSGLANTTLRWMIDEVEAANREYEKRYWARPDRGGKVIADRNVEPLFDEARVKLVLGELPPDELTPVNASLQPMYERPKSHMLHHSLEKLWWLLEVLPHLYYDKDDSAVRRRIPFGTYRNIPHGSLIHPTVRQRLLDDPAYRPKNIAADELTQTSAETDAHGNHYLEFTPKIVREHAVRQNAVVVFAVGVAEMLLALYLLWGLYRLGRGAVWVVRWFITELEGSRLWRDTGEGLHTLHVRMHYGGPRFVALACLALLLVTLFRLSGAVRSKGSTTDAA